jgi:glycine cleavage system aminomethyltransferase T
MSNNMHSPEVLNELHALRHASGWTWSQHVKKIRLTGEGAFDLLDEICPAHLYLREGGMLHTLFLDESGSILADVYVCCEDEDYLLLFEEKTEGQLWDHLQASMTTVADVQLEDLASSHEILSINGPYAWESLAKLVGGEAVGLPYMTFYRHQQWLVLRAGKTGEFGYDILIPKNEAAAVQGQLEAMAAALDMVECSVPALDQCALENCFFNIREEGSHGRTLVEFQLQWRVAADKEFVGKSGLDQGNKSHHPQRILCLLADKPIDAGMPIYHAGNIIGTLVNAGFSPERNQWVGLAMVDVALSHAGIGVFTCGAKDPVAVQSVSPPVLANRSLFINPQIHSYRTRDEFSFPSLSKDYS